MSFGLSSGGDADLPIGPFPDDQVTVEEVGWPSLDGVQLTGCRLRGFGRGRWGSDVGGHPSHGGVVVVVLGCGPIVVAAG